MSPSSFVTLAFTCAVLLATVSAVPVTVKALTTCAVLQAALPSICTCADGADLAATLTCSINPMGLDQMTATGSVAPCKSSGATIDLSVKDTKFGVSYTFPEFSSNTNGSLPVPGKKSRLRALHVYFMRLTHFAPSQASPFLRPLAPLACMPTTPSAATHLMSTLT
jgi:hypothetical protein